MIFARRKNLKHLFSLWKTLFPSQCHIPDKQWRLDWKFQGHARSVGLKVFRMDVAAVFFHNAVADAQTQSGAFTHGLGGIERIKHPVYIAKSGSIIVKAKGNAAIAADWPRS